MHTMKKIFLALGLFVILSTSLSAQDIHFSQFYMSPLQLNPAMTGVMNCNSRMVANYRNQWAAVAGAYAYNTYSASYDQKIPVGRSDYFGVGGAFWGDLAGVSRFGQTQGKLTLSYSKKMGGYRNKAHYLVMGASAAITQRRVGGVNDDLRWPNQVDNGVYDPSIEGGQIFDTDFLFADIDAGLLWFSVLDKYNNFYFGAAISHLNQPNVSFLRDVIPLSNKITIHGGGQFEISNKISLLPGAIFLFQGKHFEANTGTSVRFAMGRSRLAKRSWQLGLWFRTATKDTKGLYGDALIISSRFDYEHFGIGFSYDVNISGLAAQANGNGAFEFSLIYTICGPENRAVYCPNF